MASRRVQMSCPAPLIQVVKPILSWTGKTNRLWMRGSKSRVEVEEQKEKHKNDPKSEA